MVVTSCARVVPALLVLSLLVGAQDQSQCNSDTKGTLTGNVRHLQSVDLPPRRGQSTCVDVLTVPDDVCTYNLVSALTVKVCDYLLSPQVSVSADLKHATIYRYDCDYPAKAYTTVYCVYPSTGVGLDGQGVPPAVPAGVQQDVPWDLGVQGNAPVVVPVVV